MKDSNDIHLYRLYETIHKDIDPSNRLLFTNGNFVISPDDFFYININDNTFNPQDNLPEVLWRITGRDEIDTLPEKSFIRKYAVTKESMTALFNVINKDFNNPESDMYKEYKDVLGLDKLVNRLDPLYSYTRTAPRIKNSNVFYHNTPLADDKLTRLINMFNSDDNYKTLSEEEKKKKLEEIIGQNNDMFHDQLNIIFFALQNRLMMDFGFFTLYCVDPLTRPLITKSENYYTRNIFNNTSPFSSKLETIQFLIVNDVLNIKMNFNVFDVFDMFDLYYGLILLLIGTHVLGSKSLGKIYVSSPLYQIDEDYIHKFKSLDLSSIPHYKISFRPDNDFKDFSTTQLKHYSFIKI
jgi:hypothetical protein